MLFPFVYDGLTNKDYPKPEEKRNIKQAEKGAKRRRRGGRTLALLLTCLVLTQAQMAWAGEMSAPPSEEEGSVGEENEGRETQETGTQEAETRKAGVQNTEIQEPELQK